MVSDSLHNYNSKRVHSTLKYDFERDFIQFQKQKHCWVSHCKYKNSRMVFLKDIDFIVGDSVLLISWVVKLSNKRIRSFKRKSKWKVEIKRDKKFIASKQK